MNGDRNFDMSSKGSKPLGSTTVYADIVHWVTIATAALSLCALLVIVARPYSNLIDPNTVYTSIFGGASPEEIWSMAHGGAFPGPHYYLQNIAWGDSLAMLCLVIGCNVGLWALLPAVYVDYFIERDYFYGTAGLILAVLILLSSLGLFVF